jgi:hypothetical protein
MPRHRIAPRSHSVSPASGRVAIPRSAILLATLLATACGGGNGGDRADGSPELPDGRTPGRDGGQSGRDGGQSGRDGGQSGRDGGQSGRDGGQSGRDGGQAGRDGGQPGRDGGQAGPADAGAGPDAGLAQAPYCTLACTGPADCSFDSAPYDSDNYDCRNNVCVYTGCNSDAECQALGNYLCRASAGSAMPVCLSPCTTTSDCNLGSAPYDSDNYECENDVCVYTGCNSDAECQALGNYACSSGG